MLWAQPLIEAAAEVLLRYYLNLLLFKRRSVIKAYTHIIIIIIIIIICNTFHLKILKSYSTSFQTQDLIWNLTANSQLRSERCMSVFVCRSQECVIKNIRVQLGCLFHWDPPEIMIPGQHAAFVFILSDCLHALLLVAVRAREDGCDAEAALGYTHTYIHTHTHTHTHTRTHAHTHTHTGWRRGQETPLLYPRPTLDSLRCPLEISHNASVTPMKVNETLAQFRHDSGHSPRKQSSIFYGVWEMPSVCDSLTPLQTNKPYGWLTAWNIYLLYSLSLSACLACDLCCYLCRQAPGE